MSDRVVAVTFT